MKRFLTTALVGGAGFFAVAAVTPVRALPSAVANWQEITDQTAELDSLAQLGESQRIATGDVVARLVDGRFTLAEAVAVLDGRSALVRQLALFRAEDTDRDRRIGYLIERAKEVVGSDPGQISALTARFESETR